MNNVARFGIILGVGILCLFGLLLGTYWSNADRAANACNTYHALIGPDENHYAHDSIEDINGNWYCMDYNWVNGKVANEIIKEKVI